MFKCVEAVRSAIRKAIWTFAIMAIHKRAIRPFLFFVLDK